MKSLLKKRSQRKLGKIPSGAFSLDRDGRIIASTMPQSFPAAEMRDIGQRVLDFFRNAQDAQMRMVLCGCCRVLLSFETGIYNQTTS